MAAHQHTVLWLLHIFLCSRAGALQEGGGLGPAQAARALPAVSAPGDACWAGAEEDATAGEHKHFWRAAAVGSLLALLPSLMLGPLMAVDARVTLPEDFRPTVRCFAAGSILSAAVFFAMPAGRLGGGDEEEAVYEAQIRGVVAMLVIGWLFSVLMHFVSMPHAPQGCERMMGDGKETLQEEATDINWLACTPVLLGDVFHNMVDGFMLGFAAAKSELCGMQPPVLAGMIVASYEVPRKFGDFATLRDEGRLPWTMAMVFNLIAPVLAFVGATVEAGLQPHFFVSLGLAFSTGVYSFTVALTELEEARSRSSAPAQYMRVFLFICGALCTAAALLDQKSSCPKCQH